VIRVSCLGPEGTVSHEALIAAAQVAGCEVEPLLTATIHHAVTAVTTGEADFALVPLENSLEGGVAATLDELVAARGMTPIVGELTHSVNHRLMARTELALEDVEAVVSLPFVADQCSHFLERELPGKPMIPASSTADAVRTVAESEDRLAALGTELAARLYGCTVIAEATNEENNSTRFVWLAADPEADLPPGVDRDSPRKTSIVFWGAGAGSPGWLVECLGEFSDRGVNLTRIESRPRRDGLGSYVFFADVEGSEDNARVAEAISGLRGRAEEVRLLGSYPSASA